ncbi:MAG: hypothetical protein IPP61_04905 [Cytophagaceae bacterium]|nr:hypothetical protein [Cytophagaceae bacterium]MBL0324508.1 hypothetical protein [Cytophagaceae bacterium]
MSKPKISNLAFWDVDFEKIDFQNSCAYVSSQVFNYGLHDEMIEVLRFYGLKTMRKEIVNSAYLRKEALSFFCLILKLKETDFKNFEKWNRANSTWQF